MGRKNLKCSEGVGLQSVGQNFWMPRYAYFGSPALYFCAFDDLNGAFEWKQLGEGPREKSCSMS